jgi:hypothetical protein
MIEYLPSMHEALSSNPALKNEKEKKGNSQCPRVSEFLKDRESIWGGGP